MWHDRHGKAVKVYMEATVMHFRQGRHHQNPKQMILHVADTAEEAEKFIGKTATWTSPSGTKIKGKISALHGKKGNVRAIFAEKGLPGQTLGKKIKIE
jgi:ribosomal protein L35AE/L33A